jgi:hypothetical protein
MLSSILSLALLILPLNPRRREDAYPPPLSFLVNITTAALFVAATYFFVGRNECLFCDDDTDQGTDGLVLGAAGLGSVLA